MSRRTTNNKKNKKKMKRGRAVREKNAPETSVNELLEAASAAMESLDVEKAYQIFCRAATLLEREENNSSTGTIGIDDNDTETKQKDLIHVLEKMGELQVSIGDQDLAKKHFLQSIQLLEERQQQQPNKSFYETQSNICFYIGQLSIEKEALEAYLRGIRSLEECIQLVMNEKNDDDMQDDTAADDVSTQPAQQQPSLLSSSSSSELHELRQKLSSAYCNLAELYLTDLCEEETAESDCEHYLEKALHLKDGDGEPLVDALQNMASLRLSQQDRQREAFPFILRAYEKQRVGSEALSTLVGLHRATMDGNNNNNNGNKELIEDDDKNNGNNNGNNNNTIKEEGQAQELLEVEAASNLPEFEFRCQTAKLLLECAGLLSESENRQASSVSNNNYTNKNDFLSKAICVLGSLLAQNDEVIEIWFLTGCAFAAMVPPLTDTAKFYLERANQMLTDIQKALKEEFQYSCDSEQEELDEQLEMNATQIHDVQSKLNELPTEVGDDHDIANDGIMMEED